MQIALVPYHTTVNATVLTRVAAALQRQVSEHFGPTWSIDATISAFSDWSSVPLDYTRIALVAPAYSGTLGVHGLQNGQPYATVAVSGLWSIVASHELLELLADPMGSMTRIGPSPRDGTTTVEFLLEVCDPCEGETSAYEIDGVKVSDFATPAFYSGASAPYSFRGNLIAPRTIAANGYIVWHDPVTGDWWRRESTGGKEVDYNLGALPPDATYLRGHMDRLTRATRHLSRDRGTMRLAKNPAAIAKAKAIASVLASRAAKKAKRGSK